MRLVDLHPTWIGHGGEDSAVRDSEGRTVPERKGVGIDFDCPCPKCTSQRVGDVDKDFHLRNVILFTNPLDGGPKFETGGATWSREGETFESLVLKPSILNKRCGWHGFVGGPGGDKPGEVVTL